MLTLYSVPTEDLKDYVGRTPVQDPIQYATYHPTQPNIREKRQIFSSPSLARPEITPEARQAMIEAILAENPNERPRGEVPMGHAQRFKRIRTII